MKRSGVIGIILFLVILVAGVGWYVSHTKETIVPKTTEVPEAAYYLFSDTDNGTTTPVAVNGTVIVQLQNIEPTESVTILDEKDNGIKPKLDNYGGYFLISFTVPTSTSLYLTARGTDSASDFTMTFKPYIQ